MVCNTLEELKRYTTVVADTGDFEAVKKYHPKEATTNPSLILQAARLPAYSELVEDALEYARKNNGDSSMALDKLVVNFGIKYLSLVPGRVSTEVDARLSYDTRCTVEKAQSLIRMYEEAGIGKERILIKIAGTWEGIQAVKILEAKGIHCNVTLLFCLAQAAAAADVGTTLISPFVGRISDWYKQKGENFKVDPGVTSVRRIYSYLIGREQRNLQGRRTIVMGASFRSTEQILQLTGVDLLTISPALLEQLAAMTVNVDPLAIKQGSEGFSDEKMENLNEALFRKLLADDKMASELLADGIRRFDQDAQSLEEYLRTKL